MPKQTKASESKPSAAAHAYKNIHISLGAFTSFPAKLFAAAREQGSGFRLCVIDEDGAHPVSQFYTADMVNYFPIGKLGRAVEFGDKLIPVTSEELASLKVPGTTSIEITKFVKLTEVDPVYFKASYVIAANVDPKNKSNPGNPQAANMYSLLLAVLVQKGKVGLAKMYDRDREYNIVIRPTQDGRTLMLHTLFTTDEIRSIAVPQSAIQFTAQHLEMGCNLVDALSGAFDPAEITSSTDAATATLIARKTAEAMGEAPASEPTPTSTANSFDTLMSSLSQSLHEKKPVSSETTTEETPDFAYTDKKKVA